MSNSDPDPDAPFFVIGSPRSGTTLLERMLNRHPRLFVPPETEFFHQLRLHGLLGRPYSDGLASRFIDDYLTTRPARMLGLHNVRMLNRQLLDNAASYKDLFAHLMDFLCAPSEKPRWGEKTPHHLHTANTIIDYFPDSKLIAVLRDGRAVARSRLNKPGWEDNIFAAARMWKRDSQRLIRLLRLHGEARILTIRYEELIADPRGTLERVCTFLGELFDERMLDPRAEGFTGFESYYRQSWMAKADSAIDTQSVDAWRVAFSGRELALINHMQEADLRYWGYPVDQVVESGWRILLIKEQLRHALYRLKKKLGAYP